MKPNATRAEIIELLAEGKSDNAIAQRLHGSRRRIAGIRRELDLPTTRPGPKAATITRDRFQAHTEPADGGHLRWTGTVIKNIPVMRAAGRTTTVRRVAFELHHGRPPVGKVTASCGLTWCMAPGHADDRVTRANRAAVAALLGEAA